MSIPANEVMQIRFRTVNGLTIRYAESDGHQDSFILLTCPWPESLYAFLPIWQPLSEHSHLLAIDLPGFGQSERRNDLLSPRAMGEFIIQLLDEWGLNEPHVVAPDVGTAATLFAAALHPGKLRSLVVGSGGTAYPLQVGGALKDIIDAPDLEAFRAIDPRVTLSASLDTSNPTPGSGSARSHAARPGTQADATPYAGPQTPEPALERRPALLPLVQPVPRPRPG